MIKFEDVYTLMERCKTPYVRIKDYHGNILMSFEDNKNVQNTIDDIKAVEEMFRGYGKLEFNAGTESHYKASYKGAYKWIVCFDKEENKSKSIAGAWGQQNNWNIPPTGYMHQDVVNAKLDAIQKDIKHERELRALEEKYKKVNPIMEYMPLIPAIMAGLGQPDDKIEKMMKYYAMSNMQSQGASISGATVTNTLTFKDVEQMTPAEKNQKIQTLLDSLSSKVSAEHMILLLEAIDKKPELAEKAVNFLPML